MEKGGNFTILRGIFASYRQIMQFNAGMIDMAKHMFYYGQVEKRRKNWQEG